MRPSFRPCASLAAWYSAFSDRSPWPRASAISSMMRGRSSLVRRFSSDSSAACPEAVIGIFSIAPQPFQTFAEKGVAPSRKEAHLRAPKNSFATNRPGPAENNAERRPVCRGLPYPAFRPSLAACSARRSRIAAAAPQASRPGIPRSRATPRPRRLWWCNTAPYATGLRGGATGCPKRPGRRRLC